MSDSDFKDLSSELSTLLQNSQILLLIPVFNIKGIKHLHGIIFRNVYL